MKEVHKQMRKTPDDPVPQEAIDQINDFRTALNGLEPANAGFVIGLFKDDSTDKVTGLMVGSPIELLVAFTELISKAFVGDVRMQQALLLMLVRKFEDIKGQPGPDPHNLEDIPLDLSRFLKE